MGEPDLRGRSQNSEDNRHLSVTYSRPKDDPRHSRSNSPAPSSRTAVEDNPDVELEDIKNAAIKRRQTQVPVVNLTWWDCIKGALGFGFLKAVKRKLNAKVDIVQLPPDEPVPNHPFSLTVSVFPCPNSTVTHRKTAKCMLDTGCSQGNIISIKFAQILGYTTFEPLKHMEENGGTVATGNVHTVLGAVHISWFHNSSPKVFRDMRFLVSETAPVDLVVGSSSIVKHNLISPPNFMIVTTKLQSDPMREMLDGASKRLKRECDNVKKTKGEKHAEYKDKETQYKIAKRKLRLYDEARSLREEQAKSVTMQTPAQAKETGEAITKHKNKIQKLEKKLQDSGIATETIEELEGVEKPKPGSKLFGMFKSKSKARQS